ncbi:MAG: tetratricopeptide repeat protein [Selenomonadaceae bacterium]|nr:tetratricopeptide repeat protein [Selenomonadaceae bacterium]
MKTFSTLTIALLIIFQAVGFAATETFSASGEYLMSDYDTPEIAEEIALDSAKQNAAEQAGIYLESYSRSIDSELDADEIKTVASSKVEVLTKNITRQPQSNGRILLRADIKATVDTSELDTFLAQQKEQRQQAIQRYKELQAMNEKIKQDIKTFQAKLAAIKDDVKDDDLLVEQERINREFLAIKKSEEFGEEWDNSKDFSFNIKPLEEAIRLHPKLYWLYIEYGTFKSIGNVNALEARILANPDPDKVLSSMAPDLKELDKALILAPDEAKSLIVSMRGLYYTFKGDSDKADKEFDKAVQIDPKNAHTYITHGDSYFTKEDYNKALECYNTAIKLDPKNSLAYKSRAELYREVKKYSKAIKDYKAALKFAPKDFDGFSYSHLGDMYKELKDYPNAIKYYTEAILLNDSHVVSAYDNRANLYWEMEEYDKAVADCDKGIKAAKVAGDKFWVSQLTRQKEEIIDMRDRLSKYKNIDLKDIDSLLKRGDEYLNTSFFKYNYLRAVEDYTRALKLDPKNQLALEKRSWVYNLMDEYNLALADINKLIELNPKYEGVWNRRGIIYEKLGDYDKALADINKELENDPDSYILERNRQRVLEKINPNREINDVEELLKRAKYLKNNKEYDRALKDYNKALELEPDNQDALFSRASYYKNLKEDDKALTDLNKLLELNSNYNSTAYFDRGLIYYRLKNYQMAIQDYTKAIELNAKSDSTYNNRGVAYENLGQYDKALADYDKALELDPNDETYKNNRQRMLDKLKK